MNVRTAAKAIIIQDGKLLTIQCRNTLDKNDDFFILPGGGQEHSEDLHQTVRRECIEEINVDVEVHDLLFVREYIGKNHEFVGHKQSHQIDFMFLCTIREGQPTTGQTPDTQQIGVVWLALNELEKTNFYPHAIRKILAMINISETISNHPVYLGDIN